MAASSFHELERTETLENFEASQSAYREGFVKCQPSEFVMPRSFLKFQEGIRNFPVFEDDIWISSFPKSGTTWTQEMVWNIMNDADTEKARELDLDKRVPFLELSTLLEDHIVAEVSEEKQAEDGEVFNSLDAVRAAPRPRLIKTHLPVALLPNQVLEKAKVIYVARNPRDVVVSYYNHWKILAGFHGNFSVFFDAFLEGVCGYYSPFMQHNIDYWNLRNQENVLFITYEDMKSDLVKEIRKVSGFLKKELNSEQISKLYDHLQFDSMKNNPAVNKEEFQNMLNQSVGTSEEKFMRKGKTGDWMDKLTEEQVNRMMEWEQRNLVNSDLRFTYTL